MFNEIVSKENFDIKFKTYEQDGRIIKVVVEEDLETFTKIMEKYNPLIIDEIAIDFEELFMIEVKSRGYIND